MPTLKASLTIPHREEAERISTLLAEVFDADDMPIAHFEDEAAGHWLVEVYAEGQDGPVLEHAIRDALGSDAFAAPLRIEELDDVDWVTASLEGLQAIRAKRFVVHGIHAREAVGPTDIGIRVEASRAFGTGHHGTTLGCLELIDWVCSRRRIVNALDLGTGTGLLAMAITHLTKAPVLATDIDPICVEVTRENAKLNQLSPFIRAAHADGIAGAPQGNTPYDLIVANILAGPLIELAPGIARLLTNDGQVILSGLMRHQERAVLARYRAEHLVLQKRIHHGEWSALLLTRC
jgi:ribosomal protein L11 methyltransferase